MRSSGNSFDIGDKVCSSIQGFYYNVPGTIIRRSRVQYDRYGTNYIVELDGIDKKININSKYLRKMPGVDDNTGGGDADGEKR